MRALARKISITLVFMLVIMLIVPVNTYSGAATALKYCLKKDADSNTVSNLRIVVGEKAELKFVGTGDNWSSLFKGWKTSNSKIVDVNNEGMIIGNAVGTAQVWADLGTAYTGKVTVIVEEKKTYKVEQVSETVLKIDLGDKEITANNLYNDLVFKYNIRENTAIIYPVKIVEVKNGIATIKLYSFAV